jgi:hypothetical protein
MGLDALYKHNVGLETDMSVFLSLVQVSTVSNVGFHALFESHTEIGVNRRVHAWSVSAEMQTYEIGRIVFLDNFV